MEQRIGARPASFSPDGLVCRNVRFASFLQDLALGHRGRVMGPQKKGYGNRKPKDAAVGFKSIVEGSEHFSPVLLGAQEKRSVPKDIICTLPLGQGT